MSEIRNIGKISVRAGLFVVGAYLLSSALFYLFATLFIFRDSAIPALFQFSESIGLGANSYLLFSYLLGILVSYAFVFRGGIGLLRSRLGR
ncbi:hypothetical protein SAMN04487948_1534 [Halogranum amylolyticum]|uniref:Uncharacterized protein n=1 Tax=Halogranum amylolyticum TaxID=660520 RepID=A0A1H8WYG3_9EURY|nr:hypothetical protein SAMN04487948_1534 [Halogranum amylolyticum]